MLKVLIVDDDNNVRECLKTLIDWTELGYELIGEATNGADAYNIAVESNVDVIITDIKMPIMDGAELCKKIREVMSNVSIIFLSAYEDFTTAQMALRYNVKEYILKPIDIIKIEYLADILKEVSAEKQNQTYLNHILKSKDVDKDILYRLKGSETQYFVDFFNEMDKCVTGEFAVISAVCVKLISLLYDYLSEIGINIDIIEEKKTRLDTDLILLKNQQDMLDYTKKLYCDVLQFDNDNSRNFYIVLVNKIKEDIKSNYLDSFFSVSTIAEKFSFSADYIGKIFKQSTGTTISSYISEARMEKAMELLRDTEIPINDIATLVGYTNSNYFAKVFKSKHNMTPSSYRTKVKS